VEIFEV
jgi:hypothetical protein